MNLSDPFSPVLMLFLSHVFLLTTPFSLVAGGALQPTTERPGENDDDRHKTLCIAMTARWFIAYIIFAGRTLASDVPVGSRWWPDAMQYLLGSEGV